MRKAQWAVSSNGPDEIDAISMMTAIEAIHDGIVSLTVAPDGSGLNTGMRIITAFSATVLDGSPLPDIIAVEGSFPNVEAKTFWGHVLSQLYKLDYAIGEGYKQKKLFEKA